MKQTSLSVSGFELQSKRTRRREFFNKMDRELSDEKRAALTLVFLAKSKSLRQLDSSSWCQFARSEEVLLRASAHKLALLSEDERHRARNTRVFGSSGSGRSNTEVETGFSLRQLRDLYVQVTICTPAIRAALCKS